MKQRCLYLHSSFSFFQDCAIKSEIIWSYYHLSSEDPPPPPPPKKKKKKKEEEEEEEALCVCVCVCVSEMEEGGGWGDGGGGGGGGEGGRAGGGGGWGVVIDVYLNVCVYGENHIYSLSFALIFTVKCHWLTGRLTPVYLLFCCCS